MDKASIELTKEEAELIAKFLQTTPVTGTVPQLPKLFLAVNGILEKLTAAFMVPEAGSAEGPKRKRH